MDYEQQVRDLLARVEQADAEASESMLAFASGKFPGLWARKAAEVAERMGVTNGDSDGDSESTDADRGSQREDSGGDAGNVPRGAGGGPGRSSEDAGRPRAESAERL